MKHPGWHEFVGMVYIGAIALLIAGFILTPWIPREPATTMAYSFLGIGILFACAGYFTEFAVEYFEKKEEEKK